MGNVAKRDANMVPCGIAVSNADGTTILLLQADPVTHLLNASDGTTGSDHGTPQAKRDQDQVTAMLALSLSDGTTPVALYIDSSTNALIYKST